ncbi:hypothetical protein EJ05DRAFT_477358 [Pseudovirgaria hyperparasitica]|uniref:Uncharacterized protein n=1 Tax=Pseudovirgaria hyperparasitica TaxID=470096 RepID=A0A6A6W3J3_9PEZI|nr:uncharacterized protein EJ05DRAFT_477358 [Pseudovirgaria hyperparasitica]KAF2757135.1 hypothetical protein EJ05DRAFT_477358 [Pseudovirgaria hyperparasitica]
MRFREQNSLDPRFSYCEYHYETRYRPTFFSLRLSRQCRKTLDYEWLKWVLRLVLHLFVLCWSHVLLQSMKGSIESLFRLSTPSI